MQELGLIVWKGIFLERKWGPSFGRDGVFVQIGKLKWNLTYKIFFSLYIDTYIKKLIGS